MPDRDKGHDLSVSPHDTTGETERQLTRRLLELEKEVCVWIALGRLGFGSYQQDVCFVYVRDNDPYYVETLLPEGFLSTLHSQ